MRGAWILNVGMMNRHLVSVPTGHHLLSDAIVASPILAGEDGGVADFGGAGPSAGGGGGGGEGFEFGVDPTLDPELAMVCHYRTISPNILTHSG